MTGLPPERTPPILPPPDKEGLGRRILVALAIVAGVILLLGGVCVVLFNNLG